LTEELRGLAETEPATLAARLPLSLSLRRREKGTAGCRPPVSSVAVPGRASSKLRLLKRAASEAELRPLRSEPGKLTREAAPSVSLGASEGA